MMQKIKDFFRLYRLQVKEATSKLKFKGFIIWFFVWLPIYLIYKITGLIVYLHDFSAEIANKVDTYIIEKCLKR